MPLEISIGFPTERNENNGKSNNTQTYTKLTWNQNKIEEFTKQIQSERFDYLLSHANNAVDISCSMAVSLFNQALAECAECMRTEVVVKGKQTPVLGSSWFDQECRTHKHQAMKALRQYKRGKLVEQKANYLKLRNEYKGLIRQKKKMYHAETRKALTNHARDSRTFWSIVRKVSRRKTNEPDIGIETWKQHFAKLLLSEEGSLNIVSYINYDTQNETLYSPISPNEIRSSIHDLRASKAPGLDGIPGGCIKIACDKITPFLTKLFNYVFDTREFPECWSQSVIIPIYKKGDHHNTNNYRGISLLSALSKVFTAILARRLKKWMEQEHKVCIEQAGFRS